MFTLQYHYFDREKKIKIYIYKNIYIIFFLHSTHCIKKNSSASFSLD
jgi:hypothetical protein